jgi:hypothetical protein
VDLLCGKVANMNHNFSGRPETETWSESGQAEENSTKKRRRSRHSGKRNLGTSQEVQASVKPTVSFEGYLEYSADKLNEAIIWVRDPESYYNTVEPLIKNASIAETVSAPKSKETSEIIANHNSGSINEKNPDTSGSSRPIGEHVNPTISIDHDQIPDVKMERSYFWNQVGNKHDVDKDILPPVVGQSANEPIVVPSALKSSGPTLEQAINPNIPRGAATIEPTITSDKDGPASETETKQGFATRRHANRTVQSQTMEGETFEHIPSTPPFAEFAMASERSPEELTPEQAAVPIYGTDTEVTNPSETMSTTGESMSAKTVEKDQSVYAHTESVTGKAAIPEIGYVDDSLEYSRLLDLAESIRIDGVSVHEMYSARRIDEAGLRRIVAEYLRGGDLRDIITSEIIRVQLKFERDPQLRDTPIGKGTDNTAKLAISSLKKRTMSLVDPDRNRDRTEKLAEMTQSAFYKSHGFFSENPRAGRYLSVVAIIIIYTAILIVALAG